MKNFFKKRSLSKSGLNIISKYPKRFKKLPSVHHYLGMGIATTLQLFLTPRLFERMKSYNNLKYQGLQLGFDWLMVWHKNVLNIITVTFMMNNLWDAREKRIWIIFIW